MPTKKQPNAVPAEHVAVAGKAPKAATGKSAGAKRLAALATLADAPVGVPQVDPGRAAVLAELVKGGKSYAEATAMLDGSAPVKHVEAAQRSAITQASPKGKGKAAAVPAEVLNGDEVIDPDSIDDPQEDLPLVVIDHTPPQGNTSLEALYGLRSDLKKARNKKRFQIPITVDQDLFVWIVYATIAEGQHRRNQAYTLEDYIRGKMLEEKATDPTDGGRRNLESSGPRDGYNPLTEGWNG